MASHFGRDLPLASTTGNHLTDQEYWRLVQKSIIYHLKPNHILSLKRKTAGHEVDVDFEIMQ